ncbi:MAG: hypothetical protein K2M83_01910 [Muribaculaceae bacterium]|nr:hypothetical protein [Muribaculaceae bacterium]
MSLTVLTSTPQALLEKINKFVREGKSQTWEIDADGDFTYKPEQWKNEAWFTVSLIKEDFIVFGMWPPVGKTISSEVYAVFHGRFLEMLLTHFDEDFTEIQISALATKYDRIKSISL